MWVSGEGPLCPRFLQSVRDGGLKQGQRGVTGPQDGWAWPPEG